MSPFRSKWPNYATALVVMMVATIAIGAMTSLAVMFTCASPERLLRSQSRKLPAAIAEALREAA